MLRTSTASAASLILALSLVVLVVFLLVLVALAALGVAHSLWHCAVSSAAVESAIVCSLPEQTPVPQPRTRDRLSLDLSGQPAVCFCSPSLALRALFCIPLASTPVPLALQINTSGDSSAIP
ncbi:uncharacterized protein FIBRA_04899 [Fibroporia radiculosa]|uniref:Uncharacterized protein n=1 Tax=Fibroporia radiculosa TaxID=599839 RepID=J4G849_9APHY|nr:uncharacterized protein FIBRA_04899 [Fibroporia radiculosa]CCM02788.1 predicted protein [Fibroporia radiculosa]